MLPVSVNVLPVDESFQLMVFGVAANAAPDCAWPTEVLATAVV
jgi:hypothetical protein